MNVLDHDLEPVEGARRGPLNFVTEVLQQIFIDYTIARGEKCENVLDEVLLVLVERPTVPRVLDQVHLLHGPEGRHRLLVHVPDGFLVRGDGQEDEPVWILRLEHGR